MIYYDTTHEPKNELKRSREIAAKQETIIYGAFVARKDHNITPSEIWKEVFEQRIPLTSVRRAITDLTDQGLLIKTKIKRIGHYGKREHAWQYLPPASTQGGLF